MSSMQGIAIAAARERIRAVNELLAEDRRNLQLVQASFDAGNATRVDVLFADSELAADETLLPPASQELAVARHALAVLVGRAPAEWAGPDFDFSQLSLPATLPVSLPVGACASTARHPRGRGAIARRDRAGRRRHGEPLSAHHAHRLRRSAGPDDGHAVRKQQCGVEPHLRPYCTGL